MSILILTTKPLDDENGEEKVFTFKRLRSSKSVTMGMNVNIEYKFATDDGQFFRDHGQIREYIIVSLKRRIVNTEEVD